jgi:hypothetical protein
MLAPPLEAGAVNATLALAFAAVAVTPVGAPGTVTVGVEFELEFELEGLPPPQAANSRQANPRVVCFMSQSLLNRNGEIMEARHAQ